MYSKKFKIIKIIDSGHLVIDGGTNDGVTIGQRYQISDEKGEEMKDDDGRTLGILNTKKALVEVTTVQEHMAIVEPAAKDMFMKRAMSSYRSPLNVNSDQITGGLSESNKPINLGDTALQLPAY